MPPEAASRLLTAIDDLDSTVRDVRAAIFELHTARLPGRSVRQELIGLAGESARALGFDPVVRFDGPIDTGVDDGLANELFAVVREGLTNVAKHAKASTAQVWIEVRDGVLTATITDDGVGTSGGSGVGRGVENLRSRAAKFGGTTVVAPAASGGTQLVWTARLGGDAAP